MFWMILPAKKVLVIGANSSEEMTGEILECDPITATAVMSGSKTGWEDAGGPIGQPTESVPTFGIGLREMDGKLKFLATYEYNGKEDWRELIKKNGRVEFTVRASG